MRYLFNAESIRLACLSEANASTCPTGQAPATARIKPPTPDIQPLFDEPRTRERGEKP